QALLYHLKRDYQQAWPHALAASDFYWQSGASHSLDRIEYLLTRIALDWAEAPHPGQTRRELLSHARFHLRLAEQVASDTNDANGQVMVDLARIQYQRLTRSKVDRKAALEETLRQARALGDEALESQTLMALGDEMRAQGDKTAAHAYYRAAIEAVDGSEVLVLKLTARRALEWYEGQKLSSLP
ncbi:MAG TPA: hypothetical protein VKQ36_03040, partial [Ktedonobacterales bacterium]|nr:hypothetical protein [Ktedonobacterales bacterium]